MRPLRVEGNDDWSMIAVGLSRSCGAVINVPAPDARFGVRIGEDVIELIRPFPRLVVSALIIVMESSSDIARHGFRVDLEEDVWSW